VIESWLAALERRHLAAITSSELTRALRALSSCYVERRGRLGSGAALDGAGKRAAFATFYGPLHFITIREIVRALGAGDRTPAAILDLGCGTGVGGAAWALASDSRPRVMGIDRNPWAAAEANWTYAQLAVHGSARTGDITRVRLPNTPSTAVMLAYAVNELDERSRAMLLTKLLDAIRRGARMLVVESIALRDKPWWRGWVRALEQQGARADEWRFRTQIPEALRELARRAGLTLEELTARTLTNV